MKKSMFGMAGIPAILFSVLLLSFVLFSGTALAKTTAAHAAAQATAKTQASTHQVPLTITNCHAHFDGNVAWAHCYATGDPYYFAVQVKCSDGWTLQSARAHSPEDIYSQGINCSSGELFLLLKDDQNELRSIPASCQAVSRS